MLGPMILEQNIHFFFIFVIAVVSFLGGLNFAAHNLHISHLYFLP